MNGLTPTAGMQVFAVGIGHYAEFERLDVDTQVGHVLDLLVVPFGARPHEWGIPAEQRGADAVGRRLREWAHAGDDPDSPPGSMLYWVGHGWADAYQAALAHADSAKRVGVLTGISPQQFADAIRIRQPPTFGDLDGSIDGEGGSWALVVVDACRAQQFCRLLAADLDGRPPGRVLLIGASGEGPTSLGRFTNALSGVLTNTYKADSHIPLDGLEREFRVRCPDWEVRAFGHLAQSALVPVIPRLASSMSAPLDEMRHLEEIVNDLSPDERWHFFAKAKGAEHSEMSWFFEGREAEQGEIVSWLRDADSGMLVVTGKAGSGKSALLGNVFVHSHPGLRDALVRRGLVSAPSAQEKTPPDGVFDAVIHLSGLTLPQVISRVATAAGLSSLPSHEAPDKAGAATDLDWLTEQLGERDEPLTILVDALDEATDPLDTARSLLARIAAVPGVRVLVGARRSTSETPDAEAADTNLLDALGVGPDAGHDEIVQVVSVGREQEAIRRYVASRLTRGCAGISSALIERAAAQVSGKEGAEFLFARLAVYELIASPGLLTDGRAKARRELLARNHKELFRMAVDRLDAADDGDERYSLLLEALSLARGRGLPMADGIWAVIATALDPEAGQRALGAAGQAGEQAAMQEMIDELLHRAAAYVIVDNQAADSPAGVASGGSAGAATVYRLAHRTFVENFSADHDRHQERQRQATAALLDLADRIAANAPEQMPAYLARHLSGHIADADLWDDLAARPRVLDGLDPGAVTADAMRTLFGRHPIPPAIAGIIGARDVLAAAPSADRAGLRQLATATNSSRYIIDESTASWGIAAARAGRVTMHVRLTGHSGAVHACSLVLPDGRPALASADDEGTIRLWDPLTATPIGSPLTGHTGTVNYIRVLSTPAGQMLLVSAGHDGTVRIWDPDSGREAVPTLIGHTGDVWDACPLPGWDADGRPDGRVRLATTGTDGTVRIWDLADGSEAAPPLIGHAGDVWDACPLPGWDADGRPDGRVRLATTGTDGTVRIWDLANGREAAPPIVSAAGDVWAIRALPGWDADGLPDDRTLLAVTGYDGMVRIWDPVTGHQAREPITATSGDIWDMCSLPGWDADGQPDGRTLLAVAGNEVVCILDPVTGHQAAESLAGHTGMVNSVCPMAGWDADGEPNGRTLLVTAGDDGTVRIWDPAAGLLASEAETGHAGGVNWVCPLPGWDADGRPDGRTLVASAENGSSVRIWDPATGRQVTELLTGGSGAIRSVCALPGRDADGQTLLAAAGDDGTVRIWDPVTGSQVIEPLAGHTGMVWSVCPLPDLPPGGLAGPSALLASAGFDQTVRLWDLATGHQAGEPLTGHTGTIWDMCVLPGWDAAGRPDGRTLLASAADDGWVRIWDPAAGHEVARLGIGPGDSATGVCVLQGWAAETLPDGRILLAVASFDGPLRVWDPAIGTLVSEFDAGHQGSVNGVSALAAAGADGQPDGRTLLATISYDGSARISDPATGQQAAGSLTGHTGVVWGVCTLRGEDDGRRLLATGGADNTVRIWDPATGRPVGGPLSSSPDTVTSLAACATPGHDCIAVTSNGSVKAWTAATAAFSPVPSPRDASAVATAPGGNQTALITGDIAGFVHVTDMATGDALRAPARVGSRAVLAVCPLPGEPARIAIAGGDGTIGIVTIGPGQDTGPVIQAHDGPVRALCLIGRPDGPPLLASAGNDSTIRVWDLNTGEPCGNPLTGHHGWVWSITAIPEQAAPAPTLASAGADGTIRLWHPAISQPAGTPLEGHTDQVRAVICAASADGRVLLISGSHDGTVRLWHPGTGALVYTIPLGIPVHALLPQSPGPRSIERTGGGTTITVGLRTGILALDIHGSLFDHH
jgi:WD40 repeat protein